MSNKKSLSHSDERSILKGEDATQIGLHSVRNLLGHENQLSLFKEDLLSEITSLHGVVLTNKIDRFGIDLTDCQFKIMEGVLRGFTATNYRGNLAPVNKQQVASSGQPSKSQPAIYKNIKQIPRLRLTQIEVLELSGVSLNSIAERERAVEALRSLGTTQYCFYYDRLAYNEDGTPERDSKGSWKKEEVVAIGTLFTIKEIRDELSKTLKYYEIEISPLFLDQMDSYFMLVPYNWREEVRTLIGNKKSSAYTFRFLLFLRYEFELRRRSSKVKPPYLLKWGWDEIAIALKMPESVYKRQKARANKILEETYQIAKSLGYLTDYTRDGYMDTLFFNAEKYCVKNKATASVDHIFSEETEKLFAYFHQQKKIVDAGHQISTGSLRKTQMQDLGELLKTRSFQEICSVISWSINTKYWCTQLSSTAKLKTHFSDALLEMKNGQKQSVDQKKTDLMEQNKRYAKEQSEKLKLPPKIRIDVLGKYVEIGNDTHQPTCIGYTENGFVDQFNNALIKWGIR